MIITDITPQKRKSNRMNVFLDGAFAFSIDLETLVKYRLKVNQALTEDETTKIINETEFAAWYNKLLKLISTRPRSQKEIENYIDSHVLGEKLKSMLIDKLISLQLIDDEAFARWFIEQRQTFRPRGRRFLEAELRQKGIEQSVITTILTEAVTKSSELDMAIKVIKKKMARFIKLPLRERELKIKSLLMRLGFSSDIAYQAIKNLS